LNQATYPKRLIEVDLPIKKISEHARREKSIRHGHISTLHIWWARRPLAACRAVMCAALWPDPVDPLCPSKFREDAVSIMAHFWNPIGRTDLDFSEPLTLRHSLLDFIADFSNWDNSTKKEYLDTARALTQLAHESLGGAPGTRPLVVDPFAGGGAIPLEALRVGADAFASDLNPVAVLLNRVILEYIPKYGLKLAEEFRKWGESIKVEAEKEMGQFYPKDPDGAKPIAYLWARTVTCEGPGCGAEIPLMRSLWLAKKGNRSVALKMLPDRDNKRVNFEILQSVKPQDVGIGTIRRGSATCPICGYTTPVASVRRQLKVRKGGAADARLLCVVTTRPGLQGRFYRSPDEQDLESVRQATKELEKRKFEYSGSLSLVPDESVNPLPHSINRLPMYGMLEWGDLFTARQALALTTLVGLVREAGRKLAAEQDPGMAEAVQTCLALSASRQSDYSSSLCSWHLTGEKVNHTFGRQALPMIWDFTEVVPLSESSGGYSGALEWVALVCEKNALSLCGHVVSSDAALHPLPDDAGNLFFTDPPYYDMISYADLSDFFWVWLKRSLPVSILGCDAVLTPKAEEIIVEPSSVEGYGIKDEAFYIERMTRALGEGRRILLPSGLGVVVFAHKSTAGWEALLNALINAGWIVTGSWPIDTEMATKVAGIGQARLMSSIHLVCRPRENSDGSIRTDDIGYWSDLLIELPQRIHDWLPGLASKGIIGADAIFSCLGPALEVYSRYSRVEKANGDVVTLKEYLEEVWAAVSREALSTIFSGDTTGFEEDARLTAMWLWTLSAGANGNYIEGTESDDESEEEAPNKIKLKGFVLEYDAARKIAQGLGVHLENIPSIVEVKGDKARLLSISERASFLLGQKIATSSNHKKSKTRQMTFAGEGATNEPKDDISIDKTFAPGITVLDRLHQAMLLFSESRGEALSRFLQETGQDQNLWSLAQALAALYPPGSDERRWVEGVLARKKSLGI
jgi:putative DNA methylase